MTAAAEGSGPLRMRRGQIDIRLLQSEAFQGFALISPTLLYALILLVLPILMVIAHSLLDAELSDDRPHLHAGATTALR